MENPVQQVIVLAPGGLESPAQGFIAQHLPGVSAQLVLFHPGDIREALSSIGALIRKRVSRVIVLARDVELQRSLTYLLAAALVIPAGQRDLIETSWQRQETITWRRFLGRDLWIWGLGVVLRHFMLSSQQIKINWFQKRFPKTKEAGRGLLGGMSKRVLYLKTDMDRIAAGGSVGHVAGVADAFAKLGHRLFFVSPFELLGIDVQRTPCYVLRPCILWRDLHINYIEASYNRIGRRLMGIISQERPSLIYQRYARNSYLGVILARRFNLPFILEYNGSFVWMEKHWEQTGSPLIQMIEKVELLNFQAADLIVVVSQAMLDELVERGVDAKKILVNPNGVDPEKFSPQIDGEAVRNKYGVNGKTVVGFIGTFGPWHGADVLAKAIPEVIRKHPDAHFLFIGDGAGLPRVRRLISDASTDGFVTFTGMVPQDRAAEYLAACDLLASPHVPNPDGTPFFGSPTKLFEYMAMGKGIVASDLDQIGKVLEHGRTALLVFPGDESALAEALCSLIADRELAVRLGTAARREVVKNYTWNENVERVLNALDQQFSSSSDE